MQNTQRVQGMESKEKMWGVDGMFLHTMHVTPNGFLPGMELIDGVDQDDARRKLMNRVRMCVDDPNCVRVVTGVVLTVTITVLR